MGAKIDGNKAVGGAMTDYRFVRYETLDKGTIARIYLNRPAAPNARTPAYSRSWTMPPCGPR